MPAIKLWLLGSPRIEVNNLPVKVDTRKVMALFAYLAVMGESIRRDSLVNLLWPEYDLTRGRAVLRRTLSALHNGLPENSLVADRETIGLSPKIDLWLDVREFRLCLDRCRSHDHSEKEVCPDCLVELIQAVDLYHDDFLSGFTLVDSFNFDDWQFFQGETLRQELGVALGKLAQCLVLQGEYEAAIQVTRRRLAVDRLNEEVHCDLMRLFTWTQQRGAALRQFEECKKILQSELGVDPQMTIVELARAIETGKAPSPPQVLSRFKGSLRVGMPEAQPVLHRPDLSAHESPRAMPSPPGSAPKASREAGLEELSSSEIKPIGEKRIVTAIFFGVYSSKEQKDHEEALEEKSDQVTRFLKKAREILEPYGGQIENQVGESLLVVFGLSHTRENDAEIALRAALETQREARLHSLSLTAGVATGEVFTRSGGLPAEDTPRLGGYTIDNALFLAEQATVGEILIADSTYHFTRNAFAFTPITLSTSRKGLQGLAYQLERLLPRAQKTRGIQGMRAPMVGREAELKVLNCALEKVLTGSGQIVAITGETGVGKSRLLEEFSQSAWQVVGRDGLHWLEGRCLGLSQDISYWPFLDSIKVDLGWLAQADSQQNLVQLEKAVGRLVSKGAISIVSGKEIESVLTHLLLFRTERVDGDPLVNCSPDEIRQRCFLALRDYLMALARSQPLVLVFEDLHWADPLSMELITFLMDSLSQARILLIAIYRPGQENRTHHFLTIASQKCREHCSEIRLHDLTQEQSTQMVLSLLGENQLTQRIMALIWERCQGNPFYIEELIQTLIESGTILQENGGWRLSEMADMHELPASIQSVVLSRLDHLDEDYRQVLLTAAVIGRVFSQKVLLQALTGTINLENIIWGLEDRGLIYQERTIPEVEYSFRHVLMQEAIYHNCLHHRRKVLHLGVAQAMERLYTERLEEHFEQLAYHYEKGGNNRKAIDYLEMAGKKATLQYANDAAISSFSKGLKMLRMLPETAERNRREIDFLISLGVPLVHVHGHADQQVLDVYTQALELCQKIGDTSHLFAILLGLRRYELSYGHLSEALSLDNQMLSLSESHQNLDECVRARMMLAESNYYLADFGAVRLHSRNGLALCQHYNASNHIKLFGNDSRLGCVVFALPAMWIQGYPDQTLVELHLAGKILGEVSHPFSRVMGLTFMAKAYQLLGQVKMVQKLVEESLQISREHGFALFENLSLFHLGWSLSAQHQSELGIDLLKRGIDGLKRHQLTVFVPESLASLSEVLIWSGQAQASLQVSEEAIITSKSAGILHWKAELFRLKGEALRQLGDAAGAYQAFQAALEIATQQQAHSWALRAVTSLSGLWHEQGRHTEARALLEPVYSWFTEGFDTNDLVFARSLLA